MYGCFVDEPAVTFCTHEDANTGLVVLSSGGILVVTKTPIPVWWYCDGR